MNSPNSRSTSSLPNIKRSNTIFKIGTDEIESAEGEHLMYNAISSLSSINGPSQKPSRKRDQYVFLPITVDGFYLALLGVSTAVCSLAMDFAIEQLQQWHILTYNWADVIESGHNHHAYTFIVWSGYAVILVTSSAIFAHYFSPQAIGSGIPEMKTILRGFMLKEYLSFRTLISKMIGLTLSLGSGLPLGKEGPFVHVASALASQVSRFLTGVQGAYENESMSHELLAAGCAVGVACTFSSPIGGVLFSIEVTSAYFAVRNYWRGFFAAICAATTFRIVRLVVKASESAAAFCGSVTHTISVAVIVFELTGQLMHILPVMIAVVVGNVVCSYFQPSIYDSIIMTKALPYIPDVSHCSHDFHSVVAENIMVSDVKFIWKDMTYCELKEVVDGNREIRAFPVVLDPGEGFKERGMRK
nr:Chloride channel domain containing protein [Haemonchus contortus]